MQESRYLALVSGGSGEPKEFESGVDASFHNLGRPALVKVPPIRSLARHILRPRVISTELLPPLLQYLQFLILQISHLSSPCNPSDPSDLAAFGMAEWHPAEMKSASMVWAWDSGKTRGFGFRTQRFSQHNWGSNHQKLRFNLSIKNICVLSSSICSR
jgi:hypothetical protein